MVVDWVMRKTTEGSSTDTRWKFKSKLEDLDFADDNALLSSTYAKQTESISYFARKRGLRVK